MNGLKVGDQVLALREITEDGFALAGKIHAHASPGDTGRVLTPSDGEWTLVRWEQSGTAVDCHATELEKVDLAR